jgi:hypothetical protein
MIQTSKRTRQPRRATPISSAALPPAPHARYEIKVKGQLDARWSAWFDGMAITAQDDETMIVGEKIDQPKLRGILNKIWDLNLILVSINRIEK